MLKKAWKWLPAVVVVLSLLNACQNENTRIHPKIGEGTKTSPASVTPQPQILPTETFTPTPQLLISFDPFASESPLCQAEPDGSYLVLQCEANELSVTQSPDRRRMDIMLRREIPVQAEAVSLDIEVASIPADSVIHDQNQYGLYIVDDAGVYHALRIRGQQFINEIWSTEEEIKVETQTEPVFLSSIKTAEQINHFRWECGGGICDFYNNGDFSARIRLPDAHSIQAVGLFAASDWDETLGEVKFINFSAEIPEKISISSQPFVLTDDLTVDTGIFTQAGLSGAYDIFSDQGFHFSPIIPFETYAVQGGPALADFSVSARLRMNMDPERKASKFAGIMCRSSAVGSYAAVLRADGVYFVYRSTPASPFGLLAKGTYSDIQQPGWVDIALRLDCAGYQIDFYINDELMDSIINRTAGLGFGRAGLFAKAGGDPNPDEFIYHDLLIKEISHKQD